MVKITIFTKPKCNKCKKVKKFLDEIRVEYHEIDITEDDESKLYLLEDLKVKELPVVVGKDWYVEGLDVYKLYRKVNNSSRKDYEKTLKKFRDMGLI